MKEQTEQIDLLAKALIKFKKECPELGLNSEVEVQTKSGGKYKFKYADLSYLKKTCDPILANNGLVVSQLLIEGGKLLTMLLHESGQYISGITEIGNTTGKNAQEIGSLITYFKRYSYSAMLGISADSDTDAKYLDNNIVSLDKETKLLIDSCKSLDELKTLWELNADWHYSKKHQVYVANKKKQL